MAVNVNETETKYDAPARKAAKRARYAGEAMTPAIGKDARRFANQMKKVQSVLGDHQDAVIAREVERELGIAAHLAGENAFSYGRCTGATSATLSGFKLKPGGHGSALPALATGAGSTEGLGWPGRNQAGLPAKRRLLAR